MDEAVERSAFALDYRAKRVPIELDVGEVLEQDVVDDWVPPVVRTATKGDDPRRIP